MSRLLQSKAIGTGGRVAGARVARPAPASAPSLVLVGISEAKP